MIKAFSESKPMINSLSECTWCVKGKARRRRKNAVLSKREKQAAYISNDIEKMNQQFNQMHKSIETMDRDFVDYVIFAERNNDLAVVEKVMN